MKRSAGWLPVAVMAVLSVTAIPSWAQSQWGPPTTVMDGAWHFTIAPYVWYVGMSGDVSVANLPWIPIEATFSDMISDVDFGVQGHFEGRRDRLGFGVDVFYVDLGVPVTTEAPELGGLDLEVDARQLIAEGLFFYRAATWGRSDDPGYVDVLAGVRYSGGRNRLTARSDTSDEYDGEFQDLGWLDAVVGAKFLAPLGSRLAVLARGDVASLGSKLTWNLEGDLAFRISGHWAVGAGWRHLDIEYDEGEGRDRKVLDVVNDGPRIRGTATSARARPPVAAGHRRTVR